MESQAPFYDIVGRYLFWAPWIGLIGIVSPLILMAIFWRIYPTKLAVRWMIPLTALSVLLVALPPVAQLMNPAGKSGIFWLIQFGANLLIYFLVLVDLLVLSLLVVDWMTLTGPSGIQVNRKMFRSASLGGQHRVGLLVENLGRRTHRLEIKDDCPESMQASPESLAATLAPRKRLEVEYELKPTRRGVFHFRKIYVRLQSKLGFWHRYVDKECEAELLVYPNMQQLDEYAHLARTNRLNLIGVRKTRRAGQDNNFERLRDYNQDDNYKHIDWRATARRQKITVKQFQQDQSQRIVFMLDCGRLMTNEYKGLSLLDYAMNSILMMSYVALSQGDSVGLLCFSDKVEKYVPVRGGPRQMNHMLHGLFDRFPQFKQSNFDDAFLYFSNHCRRRTLVILISNVIDDITATQMTGYLSTLAPRHLPILCLMRDRSVFEMADNPALDESVLYRSGAAANLLLWRHEILRKVSDSGALVVDAFPDQLTAPLINRYLEVKSKHLL
ncbi:MAG: DUF58 domain-containing protein [Planctomycetota bacterium]|jgi:uncharacterized protein (DUF58 family)